MDLQPEQRVWRCKKARTIYGSQVLNEGIVVQVGRAFKLYMHTVQAAATLSDRTPHPIFPTYLEGHTRSYPTPFLGYLVLWLGSPI